MCDCNDNEKKSCLDKSVKCDAVCCFDYLKPVILDPDKGTCDKYIHALNKAKKARNAFFAAKTTLLTFVDNVELLSHDVYEMDNSENELDNAKQKYITLVENLATTMYSSLIQVGDTDEFDEKLLVNTTIVSNDDPQERSQKSNPIYFEHPCGNSKTVVTSIPGVSIELNTKTNELTLKMWEPNNIPNRYYTSGRVHKNNDSQTQTFIISPALGEIYQSSKTYKNVDNQDDGSMSSGGNIFDYLDSAQDYLDEIVNYSEQEAVLPFYNNEIFTVVKHFDRVIGNFESAHKFMVQFSKINNSGK